MIQDLKAQVATNEQEISDLNNTINLLTEQNQQLNRGITTLTNQLNEARAEHGQSVSKLQATESLGRDLEGSLNQKKDEADRLTLTLMESNDQIKDFSKRVVQLETALSACEIRNRQLEDQLNYMTN